MLPDTKHVCIFGGTGFVGRTLVQELAKEGCTITIATRIPERAFFLRPCGAPGQIVPVYCDYGDASSIEKAIGNCGTVINLIGILYEKGRKSTFKKTHMETAEKIAKACAARNVRRLVHISALGIEQSASKYARSKRNGEEAVRTAFPKATILRPSVIFGPGDGLFCMFARLSVFLPALPLIGGGKTKFQPVYVGDVARAVTAVITATGNTAEGRTYALGGPDIMTLKQIYEKICTQTGRQRCLMPVPWPMAKIQGIVLGMLPGKLLTADQVESLKTDSVVPKDVPTLRDLGITPTSVDAVLPRILSPYQSANHNETRKSA